MSLLTGGVTRDTVLIPTTLKANHRIQVHVAPGLHVGRVRGEDVGDYSLLLDRLALSRVLLAPEAVVTEHGDDRYLTLRLQMPPALELWRRLDEAEAEPL